MPKCSEQNELVENEVVIEILNMLWKQDLITEQERDRAIVIVKSGN